MGITAQYSLCVVQMHRCDQFLRALKCGFTTDAKVHSQDIRDLRVDARHRVERSHGILWNERDVLAKQCAAFALRHISDIAFIETNLALRHMRIRWRETKDDATDHGLTGAGFTD